MALDSGGWTVFTQTDGTIYYCSDSGGDDGNSGLSPSTPLKTLTAATAKLTKGSADWLLLKKGDTWSGQTLSLGNKQGKSASEPMLISSYGSGSRPIISPASGRAIFVGQGGGGGAQNGSNVALADLDLYCAIRDPDHPSYDSEAGNIVGVDVTAGPSWFLVEGCRIRLFAQGIGVNAIDTRAGRFTIRRNIIVDQYDTDSEYRAQGVFLGSVDNIRIEENVFDRNGWHPDIEASQSDLLFNHNIYLGGSNGRATVRGNVSARAGSHGMQCRPGGIVYDNLLVENAVGINVAEPNGGRSLVRRNVVLRGTAYGGDLTNGNLGWGIERFGDYQGDDYDIGSTLISENIVADRIATGTGNDKAIILSSTATGNTVSGNIIRDWGASNQIDDNGSDNTVSGNSIDAGSYSDPDRTIASYMATLGGTQSVEAFLSEARLQSKANWRPAYTAKAVNDYIRDGYDMPRHRLIELRGG